jgi:alkylation response protein AidB-like acyl-CoA dehydrogenase
VDAFQASFARWLDDHAGELEPMRHPEPPSLEVATIEGAGMISLLYDAGWNRWGWPEVAGGLGGNALHRAAFYEQLSASGYRLPQRYYTLEILGPALLRFAPALGNAFLPPFLKGEEMWCQGFSEPDAGSDLGALRLRAEADGDRWRVSGQKVWTSYAHVAQRCCLLARTGSADSGYRGLTMFWVDMDSAGILPRPLRAITGRNEFAEVFFDDVVVPGDRVVGEVGRGWDVAMYLLQWERGMYAWQVQSKLHARLQELVLQAGGAETVADRIGEAYQMMAALRVMTIRTVKRLVAGETSGPEISADKILLAVTEQTVFDLARQLLSPGFEYGGDVVSEAWREDWFYSRAATIYGGAIEVQRDIVAERLLGLPRERSHGR